MRSAPGPSPRGRGAPHDRGRSGTAFGWTPVGGPPVRPSRAWAVGDAHHRAKPDADAGSRSPRTHRRETCGSARRSSRSPAPRAARSQRWKATCTTRSTHNIRSDGTTWGSEAKGNARSRAAWRLPRSIHNSSRATSHAARTEMLSVCDSRSSILASQVSGWSSAPLVAALAAATAANVGDPARIPSS